MPTFVTGRLAGISVLLVLGLFYATSVVAYNQSRYLESQPSSKFDNAHLLKLERQNPDLVFIGNSIVRGLGTEKYLSKLTGKTVAKIVCNASSTPAWYLWYKNYIVRSGTKPQKIVVIFRDTNLTTDRFYGHARGSHCTWHARMESEPALEKGLGEWEQAQNTIYQFAEELLKIEKVNTLVEKIYSGAAELPFIQQTQENDRGSVASRINAYFDEGLKRRGGQEMASDLPDESYDLREHLKKSLIVEFIRLAQKQDQDLVFVHWKTSSDFPGAEASCFFCERNEEKYAQYKRDLRQYIEDAGFAYYDLSEDERIKFTDFRDDLGHLKAEKSEWYTQHVIYPLLTPVHGVSEF